MFVCLLVVGGFVGFIHFGSENTQSTPVSGIIYNGSGGPWTPAGSPYIVVGDVTVPAGETLTIEPGVVVKFDGYYSIIVDGTLHAVGNATSRINITSNKTAPAPGNWDRIQVNSGGHAEISYSNISYGEWGIYLDSSSNNNITGNNVSSNIYDGIYLYSSSNNNITGNNLSSNNGNGISLVSSSNNNITGNNLSSNNGNGIFLYTSSNNNITGNNLSNSNNGIYLRISSNNNITGNNVSSNTYDGIYLYSSSNNNITGNNLSANKANGIYLYSSSNNNRIIDNNVSSNNVRGIVLFQSSNINITGNTFINDGVAIAGYLLSHFNSHNIPSDNIVNRKPLYYYKNCSSIDIDGIPVGQLIFTNCTDVNVRNLQIDNTDYGINVAFSTNVKITDSNLSNNWVGFALAESSNNNITGNNLSNNVYGIILELSSNNNITGNNVSSNGLFGINLKSSSANNIKGNNISSNGWDGIMLWSISNNNKIYHNNFIDNHIQAVDDSNNGNQWDNGYSTPFNPDTDGGNYWSDFDEPSEGAYDDYRGPNQDDPTSGDSIVDKGIIGGGGKNPYVIDSDSQDNYPLINPVDNWPPTITNLQPPDASTTNDNTPTISANYSDPSGINVSSVLLEVDSIDVTPYAIVTASGVSYIPGTALPDGIHTVYLEVKDNAGNLATITWSFTVDTALPPITNLTTKVVNNGNNVELEWDSSSSLALDHYLIYRADSATGFDFKTPYNSSTTWPNPKNTIWIDPDPNVTAVDDDFYYIVRAANFDESDISSTSNTAGVWTRTFESGTSTFSLPLEPFVKKDAESYCQDMNASYIKWMNATTHTWMRHDKGSPENIFLMELGNGYEVNFPEQTRYSFTGMPGAMISYDDDILFPGFDPDSDAKNLTASVDPNGNVTLTWQEPSSMGVGDWYEVYYSNTRDGFFGTLGTHYNLSCPAINYGTNTTTIVGLGANNPGARLCFMVVPFSSGGIRGSSTYSIGIWTEEYLSQYDTFGIPLKLNYSQTADWFCDSIPDTVGINYYNVSGQRWCWHSKRMPAGAFDPILVMTEGYQISTSGATKFTFIGG